MSSTKALWGGRFRSAPDPMLTRYSRSDASHIRLVSFDVAGSRAHARELVRAGILTDDECRSIVATLDAIAAQAASGEITPVAGDEDIHTFIERHLMERLGDLGGKLRAGR